MAQDNNWQQQVWQQQTPPANPGAPQQAYPAPPYYPPQPPQKSKGWIVGIVAVLLIFAVIALGMWSCTSMVNSSVNSLGSFGYSDVTSDADYLSSDAIGVITIDGAIQYDGSTSSPEGLKAQLDRAEQNSRIKAVVLRIDSGGGVATAGEEMSNYVKNFSKPIVVSSASMNASAAYEISSQTDYIFTAKTTAIGSIGTALQITDLSGLYEKLGISIDTITSSGSKDSSYGNRPLTEEERTYYQNMVTQINETFIQTVAEGRKMDVEAVRELATGMTFTGMEAIENGLADQIGSKEDAVAKAAELAGVSTTKTVKLEDPAAGFSDLFGLLSSSKLSVDDINQAIKELEQNGNVAR